MTNRTPIPAFPQRREGAISRKQRGFTLIELIIFIVVVSIGLAGILSVINTVVKSSADPMIRKQTIAIAESLLEEILLKEYCDPNTMDATTTPHSCYVSGGDAGGIRSAADQEASRADYDDVDDYNGYQTTNGIVDAFSATTPLPLVVGLEKYNISAVTVVRVLKATGTDLNNVEYKKVTVTVTGPQGSISLTGYRTNY